MVVAWLSVLAYAGPAVGATVSVGPSDHFAGLDAILFVAEAGETNSVTITYGPSVELEITDGSATITAGPGCTSLSPETVSCTDPAMFDVKLGDGNDFLSLEVESIGSVLRGGNGNDRISGGENFFGSREYLFGGRGNDVLRGRWGVETLNGGPGADTFRGGTSCDPGTAGRCSTHRDTVTYAGRVDRVKADADGVRDDGERGEGDLIAADIERLIGGRGDDVLGGLTTNVEGFDTMSRLVGMSLVGRRGNDILRGGRARDFLNGGPGSDVLRGGKRRDLARGRGGSDAFFGGAGRDRLSGGSGHDRLIGGNGADRLLGGKGRDTLRARDGQRDVVDGGRWHDRARVDPALDRIRNVETLF